MPVVFRRSQHFHSERYSVHKQQPFQPPRELAESMHLTCPRKQRLGKVMVFWSCANSTIRNIALLAGEGQSVFKWLLGRGRREGLDYRSMGRIQMAHSLLPALRNDECTEKIGLQCVCSIPDTSRHHCSVVWEQHPLFTSSWAKFVHASWAIQRLLALCWAKFQRFVAVLRVSWAVLPHVDALAIFCLLKCFPTKGQGS